MRPSVTVGLPVFNGSRFVREAIDSVLAQEGWDVHVVAVDDGSTDHSLEVLSEAADCDSRVTVIALGSNRGVAHARNTAIATRDDPLVAFIDQDDCWRPGRLDAGWACLSSRPDLGFCVGRQEYVLADGPAPSWFRSRWAEGSQPGYLLGALLAWRDRGWTAVGPLDESLRAGTDDVAWFARAQRVGVRHASVPDTLLTRRVHQDNASQRTHLSTPELTSVLRDHLRRRDADG